MALTNKSCAPEDKERRRGIPLEVLRGFTLPGP